MFRTLTQGWGFATLFLFATSSFANTVHFAVPYYMAPKSTHGVHLEVIQAALKKQEFEVIPVYLPGSKISEQIAEEKVAGGFLEDPDTNHQFFSSNAYAYTLKPIAVSLKSKDLQLQSTADLSAYRVIGFDNAKEILGSLYKQVTANNDTYQEKANQNSQVQSLFLKKADVIVLADSIFEYYKTLLPKGYSKMEVVYHHILKDKKSTVQPVFRDKRLREAFEAGIKQLRASGELKTILQES